MCRGRAAAAAGDRKTCGRVGSDKDDGLARDEINLFRCVDYRRGKGSVRLWANGEGGTGVLGDGLGGILRGLAHNTTMQRFEGEFLTRTRASRRLDS